MEGVEELVQSNKNRRKDNKGFPLFICPKCRVKVQLDFDPLKFPLEWHIFSCPGCEYHNEHDDYIAIETIKLTFLVAE